MKNIGVWLDKEKAHIVRLENGKESFETLASELEFFNPWGGSRSKTGWGPQQVVQDSRYLEREKNQLRVYFKKLADAIADADAIVIYGPAEAGAKFVAELQRTGKATASKVRLQAKTDSMTDNQLRALVRDFFN